jgi:hypothetical protein
MPHPLALQQCDPILARRDRGLVKRHHLGVGHRRAPCRTTSRSMSSPRSATVPRPSSAEGLGAGLVQITAPSGAGSPDATPRVNGSAGKRPLRKQFVSVGFRAVYASLPNEQVRQRAVTFTQARIANAG